MTTITEAHIGRKGTFKGGKGIIRYVGETEFADGVWIGLELETPTGKNDGSVKGKKYFETKPKHGSFVRLGGVALVAASAKKKTTKKGDATKKTRTSVKKPATAKKASTTAKKTATSGAKKTTSGAKKPPVAKKSSGLTKKASAGKLTGTTKTAKRPSVRKPAAKTGVKKTVAKSPTKKSASGAKKATTSKTKKPLTAAEKKKKVAAMRSAGPRKATGKRTTATVGAKKKTGTKTASKGKATAKSATGAAKKKKVGTKTTKKKASVKKKKSAEVEAEDAADEVTETGEDLRSRILARLQMDGVKMEGDSNDIDNNVGAEEDQQSLAEKIQERLSNLHKAVDSPEPTPEKAEKGDGDDDGDDDGTAMPPAVAKGPKTEEDFATLIQAQFRGTLIRTEQLNLLEASVKLLVVKDEQWTVLGQGTATVEGGLKDPYVRVDGWLLSKRAWDSNKELLLEQNIDWMNGPTCETDDVGPPIFVLEQSEDNEIYGLEFALRGDETEFEEEFDVARRDAGAIRIQAVVRGALARWKLHGHPEPEPEEPKAMTTPSHHPPLGSTIEVRRGMFKKKKIGKLIDFNNFTGQYKIQFDTGKVAKWYDLDKVTYKRLGAETTNKTEKAEEPEAAAAAAPEDEDDADKKKDEEGETEAEPAAAAEAEGDAEKEKEDEEEDTTNDI